MQGDRMVVLARENDGCFLSNVLVHSQGLVKRRGAGGGGGHGTFWASEHINRRQSSKGRPIWLHCGKTVINIYLLEGSNPLVLAVSPWLSLLVPSGQSDCQSI